MKQKEFKELGAITSVFRHQVASCACPYCCTKNYLIINMQETLDCVQCWKCKQIAFVDMTMHEVIGDPHENQCYLIQGIEKIN